MSISTYLTGWITTKAIKTILWFAIPLLFMYQCNRSCNSEPQIADSSVFDYSAIAASLPKKDTTWIDTTAATYELKEIIPSEMIEFTKAHSGLFAKYLGEKYKVNRDGYIEKIE